MCVFESEELGVVVSACLSKRSPWSCILDLDSLEIAVSNLDHAPLEVSLFFRRVDFAELVFPFLEVVIEVVLPGTWGFLA